MQAELELAPANDSLLVCPLASGSVVQSSPPAVRASTKKLSHPASVVRRTQKDSCAPPSGTLMVRVRRL